jgi:hypothetical protein
LSVSRTTAIAAIIAAGSGLFFASSATAMQDSVKRSMDYVSGLGDDCVYDDGYRCVDVTEDDFIRRDPHRPWIPCPYLEAWMVSFRDFQKITEMNAEQKKLKHYKIGFTQSDTHYIILYRGLLLPMLEDGKPVGTMRATFGLSTKYWINRQTLEVDKRLFLR